MTFNFDQEVDRSGTSCLKWEFRKEGDHLEYGDHAHRKHGRHRHLPMWVADMDFQCPPAVVDALEDRARQGVFGYSYPTDSYYQAVIDWLARRQQWAIEREWVVLTPGIVPALNMLVRTFIAPGEKVLIQQPVYHQFMHAIENNRAVVVSNSLVLDGGAYQMDFDDLAAKAADPTVKMAILCSPHNPVSRVWSAAELRQFGQICLDNDVLVVSDEIHGDLILDGHRYVPFGALGEKFVQNSILCTAPSKTFNLAGLKISSIIIANQSLRQAFQKTLTGSGLFGANAFGLVATEAAYNHGEAWLDAALAYIKANFDFLDDYLKRNIPQLKLVSPEGTYLGWVDCRQLGLGPERLHALFCDEAKVLVEEGESFGPEGTGFVRMNLACPRAILVEAIDRIAAAVQGLEGIRPGPQTAA